MLSTSDMKTYSTDCLSSYCAQVFPADLQNHAAYFILSLMCFSRPMNLGHFHSCTQQDVDTFSLLTAWGCNDKPQLEVPQFKAALVLNNWHVSPYVVVNVLLKSQRFTHIQQT